MRAFYVQAQNHYGISPYPDVWYNSVDGVRLGVRVIGEEIGAFKEGPHQLDAGVWVGTNFPANPVSYYFSLTEPIPAISGFAEEGSFGVISSIRTGYARHGFQFNKRWQAGFNENNYQKFTVSLTKERNFENEYRQYSFLWEENWKDILGVNLVVGFHPEFGRFLGEISVQHSFSGGYLDDSFTTARVDLKQSIILKSGFKLRLRGFAGLGSDNTAPEYLFLASSASPISWLDEGYARAEGTVPVSWFDNGITHFQGGANLRGYLDQEMSSIAFLEESGNIENYSMFRSVWSVNAELEFPNPINNLVNNTPVLGDLVEFRSYIFGDFGTIGDRVQRLETNAPFPFVSINPPPTFVTTENELLADAGAGLQISFNIPDYLANDRGLFLRYEVPFWLSAPQEGDPNFKYRTLIGFGAIFSF